VGDTVLIAVVGSSGLDEVEGIPSIDPAALLRTDRSAQAAHVVLLAPWYAATTAKEQAHVLIAAAPRTSVAVLTPQHHPLTLTLIGAAAQQTAGPDADPGLVVALVNTLVCRSRSLVWYPRAWGLREPAPTAVQLAASIFRSPGYFREIGAAPALLPARAGSPVAPTNEVYVAGASPALLHRQLGGAAVRSAAIELEPGQPYGTKSAVPLTVLADVATPAGNEPACPSCGARLVGGGCCFCGLASAPAASLFSVLESIDHG
jgi:hypothetical protein